MKFRFQLKFVNNAISIKKEAIVKTSIDIFPFSSPSFFNAEFKFEVIANKSVNIVLSLLGIICFFSAQLQFLHRIYIA